jgi:hypothetical protein
VRVLDSSYSAFRRLRALAIIIMAGALLLVPAVRTPLIQAMGTILATQNISNTSDMSEAPQIALGGGHLGAVWGERGSSSIDWSITTPTIAWPDAGSKATGTSTATQFPDVAVDSAGTLHILYAVQNTIYHRSDPTTGGLSGAHKVASSEFPNPVRLAIAPNGTLWAVWRDTDGKGVFYKQSTDGGLNWTNGSDGGTVASETGNMFAPDVAVGPDNIPHVVWYLHGAGRGEVHIADWNGSSFVKSNVTTDGGDNSCCYDADASIAIGSGGTIHLVWRKRVGDNWAITYANRPPGGIWQNFTTIAVTSGDAKYSPSIGIDSNATVYIIFSSPTGGSKPRKAVMYFKAAGASWDGPLAIGAGKWDSRTSVVGGSGEAHVLYQQEFTQDHDEIIYSRVRFVAPLSATPVLDSGQSLTRNSVVTVSFTNVSGSPDSVRYHWDAPPTDSDAWVTFANPLLNVPEPSGVSGAACETHTLYTQVRKGSTIAGSVGQDSEVFDTGVQANVNILNPHLSGLPTFFGQAVQDVFTGAGGSGASDGDPNYTRERLFYLGIAGSADCSGLSTYNVTGSSNGSITNNSYTGTLALPGASTPGPRTVSVEVKDALGNPQTYSNTLVYDPPSDPMGLISNTLGLPVLADGGSVTADSANSIIRTLSFKNINVDDNLYGKQDGPPKLSSGKRFWGVWIANTTSPTATADDASLNWYPVRVAEPDSSFTMQWSLFAGLNITLDLHNHVGNYYVFVRFLDGAGNASANAIKSEAIPLTAGYDIPTVLLPMQNR